MKREAWIDSCRFLAIFVIMVTHFIASVAPSALSLWENGISSWFLYGLTGKFSVAFFFVLLGYFASKPAEFSLSGYARYSFRRYFQFAFYILICSVVYVGSSYLSVWLFHSPDPDVLHVLSDGPRYNLISVLRDSFLFEDNYNATLWCMQQLFIASLICKCFSYIPQKLNIAYRFIIAFVSIGVLMLINSSYCVWIAAAVLGYVLRLCLELKKELSRPVIILLLIGALVLIKFRLPEGVLQYSIQSVAAFLLILAQFNMPGVQKALSSSPLPWLGEISMGLFVVHTPVYSLLASTLYPQLLRIMGAFAGQSIYFIVSIILCVICSLLLSRAYAKLSKALSQKSVKL